MIVPAPISDSGMVTTGIATERGVPRNRKMTTMTISTASPSVHSTSLIDDLMNLRRIVGDLHRQRRRQRALDLRQHRAHVADDGQRIAGRRRVDADEDRVLAVQRHAGIGVARTEIDGGDVAEAHLRAALRLHHHVAELLDVGEAGIGGDVGDGEIALGLAGRRLEIVGADRRSPRRRRRCRARPSGRDRARPAWRRSGRRGCWPRRRRRSWTAAAAPRASDSRRSPAP